MTEECLVRPFITAETFFTRLFSRHKALILFEKVQKPAPEIYSNGVWLVPVGRALPRG